jgi:hypothetical protein
MWDLLCTKWHWGRFYPSISASLANTHSTEWAHPSSAAGTIGKLVAEVASVLSLTPLHNNNNNSVALVRERTILPKQLPLVGEVNVKF